jgi:hypothetical protein
MVWHNVNVTAGKPAKEIVMSKNENFADIVVHLHPEIPAMTGTESSENYAAIMACFPYTSTQRNTRSPW